MTTGELSPIIPLSCATTFHRVHKTADYVTREVSLLLTNDVFKLFSVGGLRLLTRQPSSSKRFSMGLLSGLRLS